VLSLLLVQVAYSGHVQLYMVNGNNLHCRPFIPTEKEQGWKATYPFVMQHMSVCSTKGGKGFSFSLPADLFIGLLMEYLKKLLSGIP
jgi:hypothetical protein